ncbi:L-fuculose-phosphate aldolase [Maridesulfovibrio salexigens]|uniref:Class II aldolase/adducin family protein n=1 Tax=Maridesulfovibrio salexigens (strain ATCC 14822 / DSM 2638 / NCIMB 8403 / VKM B-1763) TaxID=526222 RepID=C6C0Y6_MARSD|nr:L-fuculose-phosphate aldolase [Maridesulfovibrio salexigens]ACS81083.1 class II aldolase/adducin family protein [Maridesulfovibrio salexigens DSM 2638]
MLLQNERKLVVEYGKKLLESGLTTGTGGNLSVFNREQGLVAISPSGLDYRLSTPEDIVIIDLDGNIKDSERKPSSEYGFHTILYKNRPDVNAVVHTHSVYATTVACLNVELPAVHYLVGFAGKKVPLAPYATFGTPELADNVIKTIGNYNAVLLANHGLITVGRAIGNAFDAAEELELVARIYIQALSVGKPVIVPDDEMDKVIDKFSTYGQAGGKD